MRAPASAPARRRKSQTIQFPAATSGWVSNRSLANPRDGKGQGAAVLENFFPTATSIVQRRGSELYATLGGAGLPVLSLFTYIVGNIEEMFAANENTIYNITTITTPFNYTLMDDEGDLLETDTGDTFGQNSTDGLEMMEGFTSGNWSVVQTATAGGVFLLGVNGSDLSFIYDGANFYPQIEGGVHVLNFDNETTEFTAGQVVTGGTSGATGTIYHVVDGALAGTGSLWITDISGTFVNDEVLTDGAGGSADADGSATEVVGTDVSFEDSELTTADLIYIWVYKSRVYGIQKDSLNVWYLEPDSVGGEWKLLPLGASFNLGGSLLFGATWSLDSGGSGGLSEQIAFFSTEGEVAVFQGLYPGDTDGWRRVGVYRIGNPMGSRAHMRAGADILVATNVGMIPLSQAIQRDYAALAPAAVSFPIEVAWNEAVTDRGEGWICQSWPEGQMVVVALPFSNDDGSAMFVANARTGAWAKFTGWNALSMVNFRGSLFFGSTGGRVIHANVTGADEGMPYVGSYVPLFDDNGAPMSRKAARIAKVTMRGRNQLKEQVSCLYDFNTTLPPAPSANPVAVGSEWGNAIWGTSKWGGSSETIIMERRHSLSGYGYRLSPAIQITSGAIVPNDAEIISVEVSYEQADALT